MSWARRRDQTRRRAGTAARWALTRARAWLAPHDDGATRPSAGPDTSDVNRMFEWCQATTGSRYRPQYLWPTLQSASSAKALGVPRISVVEFGVAGGNGLLALEEAAAAAESLLGIGVAVAGFDTGKGLPPPVDHRDVPFVLRPGYFEMDERALRDRLSRAELVLGPVAETLGPWLEAGPAPVGFAAFDLDYWSSTVDALRLFDARDGVLLPRILCYFDDILGVAWGDFNGERAAIADFNAGHERRKLGPLHGMRHFVPPPEHLKPWPEQLYMAHLFDHGRYNDPEGEPASFWFEELRLPPTDG